MITKVRIRNFKNLRDHQFELGSRAVLVGLNNSGKTSLLQAISTWSALATHWFQTNSDFARDAGGDYPSAALPIGDFHAVPLTDFQDLWSDRNVEEPLEICLWTPSWTVAFEALWRDTPLVHVRPAKDVSENGLEAVREQPLDVVYVPAASGLDVNEPPLQPEAIGPFLAEARPGSMLRNLLHQVSRTPAHWARLQSAIRECFECELLTPSPAGTVMRAHYRHGESGIALELGAAAAGFLQVLLLHAAILHTKHSVALVDEPEAHLHGWLQQRVLRDLWESARLTNSQVIATTHSVPILRIVDPRHLSVLVDGDQKMVATPQSHATALRAIAELGNLDVTNANVAKGILYTEGRTDLNILRSWARQLDHRALKFLAQPFWKPTVQDVAHGHPGLKAEEHFSMLRAVRSDLPGLVLVDRDGRTGGSTELTSLRWRRREIESYLFCSDAVRRAVEREDDPETAATAQRAVSQYQLKDDDKPSDVLERIMRDSGASLDKRNFYRIAQEMVPEEIAPEVVEKLDGIADRFGL